MALSSKFDLSRLLEIELKIFGINQQEDGKYLLVIADNVELVDSLSACKEIILHGTKELKSYIYDNWQSLYSIINEILTTKDINIPSFDNSIFLANVRKTYELTTLFNELSFISQIVERILYLDITNISNELIKSFNDRYIVIRSIHSLIMKENYRVALIDRISKKTTIASISGPWANLDIPMSERMWSAAEDEEYFEGRQDDRRAQSRYNPEYDVNGFYAVWPEAGTREPYTFDDIDRGDSIYKGNKYYQQA